MKNIQMMTRHGLLFTH